MDDTSLFDSILTDVKRLYGFEAARALSSMAYAGVAAHNVGQTSEDVRQTYGTEHAIGVLGLMRWSKED